MDTGDRTSDTRLSSTYVTACLDQPNMESELAEVVSKVRPSKSATNNGNIVWPLLYRGTHDA
jgi:hypothetical protein